MNSDLSTKEVYKQILETIPNSIVVLFDTALKIQAIWGSELYRFGFESDYYIGKTITESLGGNLAKRLEILFQDTLRGFSNDLPIQFMDESYTYHSIPWKDEKGAVFAGVGTFFKTTELDNQLFQLKTFCSNLEAKIEDKTKNLLSIRKEIEEIKTKYQRQSELVARLQQIDSFDLVAIRYLKEITRQIETHSTESVIGSLQKFIQLAENLLPPFEIIPLNQTIQETLVGFPQKTLDPKTQLPIWDFSDTSENIFILGNRSYIETILQFFFHKSQNQLGIISATKISLHLTTTVLERHWDLSPSPFKPEGYFAKLVVRFYLGDLSEEHKPTNLTDTISSGLETQSLDLDLTRIQSLVKRMNGHFKIETHSPNATNYTIFLPIEEI